MALSDVKEELEDLHADSHPQKRALVMMLWEEIENAVAKLAGHGHRLVVGFEKTPASPMRYPMMMYHLSETPKTVNSQEEEDEAEAAGWDIHSSAKI